MDTNRRRGRGRPSSESRPSRARSRYVPAVPDARLSQPTVDSPSLQPAARWKTCESTSQEDRTLFGYLRLRLYVRRSIHLMASAGRLRRLGGGSGWRVST
jgi:hypothetical protein